MSQALLTAHRRVTGPIVLATFRDTVATYGVPGSTLTDNGMVFTTRLAGGRGGHNAFDPRRDYQPTKRPPGPHRTHK